jgi:ABC-type Zn uptake system ZnuABC Zn-binding protein ZnuA
VTRRALALAAAACALGAAAAHGAPLRVVATIEPIAMLVREVAGPRASVAVLVPPGASPHTFEPKPSDVARLVDAALVVEAGAGLDGWLRALLAAASHAPARLTLVEASGVDPLPAAAHADAHAATRAPDGRLDPHVWLDPLRVRDALVPALVARLAALDPAQRAAYEAAGRDFAARLGALDADVRAALAGRGRRFVAFHAAWRYFAQRYGLEEIGVVEEAPGEEPTPRELADLVARARAAGVPPILVEPQLSPRVARALAAEFGATTVLVDPNGDPSDPARDSYAELMRWNAAAFARALGAAP